MSATSGRSEIVLHRAELLVGAGSVEPQRDRDLIVDSAGRILSIAPAGSSQQAFDRVVDHQILMPGVLNCHVHMTDANIEAPVPGGSGLVAWVQELLSSRRNGTADTATIAHVLGQMRSMGTVAIGEVVNDRSTLEGIRAAGMRCRYIHELLAFPQDRADALLESAIADLHDEEGIDVALGLHAPYSVSPRLHMLAAEWSREQGRPVYEHLAEDPDERKLYLAGSGTWRELLARIGAWDHTWAPPGISPIEALDRLGVIDSAFVAVHLADASASEIALLSGRGARAILSPRSNLHITGLYPPVGDIVRAGMRFALGTDGRGSSPTIDVFDEAATILRHGPALPPGRLLEALTIDGASILGMPDLGTLAVGNAPGLVSVETEAATDDLATLERAIILDGWRSTIDIQLPSYQP